LHILPFQRFAQSLRADYDVVKAGVPLAVNNGQIEGQNNRLKMLKRQIRRCMDEMGLIYLGSIELQPPWLEG
jgi:hypothetical protein